MIYEKKKKQLARIETLSQHFEEIERPLKILLVLQIQDLEQKSSLFEFEDFPESFL